MPTYEYGCEKGHTFERIQKMSEKPVARCPVCGAKASRIISGGQGVIFKGTGFYITDYGKDGKGARKDPDSAPKSEGKAESKPGSTATDAATTKSESKSEPKPVSAPKPAKPDAS